MQQSLDNYDEEIGFNNTQTSSSLNIPPSTQPSPGHRALEMRRSHSAASSRNSSISLPGTQFLPTYALPTQDRERHERERDAQARAPTPSMPCGQAPFRRTSRLSDRASDSSRPQSPSPWLQSPSSSLLRQSQSSRVPQIGSYSPAPFEPSQEYLKAEALHHAPIEDLLWIPSVAHLFNECNNLRDMNVQYVHEAMSAWKQVTHLMHDMILKGVATGIPASDYSSVAQNSSMTMYGNSSQRPGDIPISVLWTFSDCKADPTVGMTGPNPSRPNMSLALRNKDGSTIDNGTYQLICRSARSIANSILLPLKPANFPKGSSLAGHLQTNNPTQWTAALLQLERQHPLVGLCAEHWKAKHLLQAVLRLKGNKKKDGGGGGGGGNDDDEDVGEDNESDDGGDGGQSNKRPRALSGGQSVEKRPRTTRAAGPSSSNNKASPRVETFMPVAPPKKPTPHRQTTPSSSRKGKRSAKSPPPASNEDNRSRQTREDTGADSESDVTDISYIQVSAEHDNLLRIFNTTYPDYKSAIDLLLSLCEAPLPSSLPSEMVKDFIHAIETADPNSGDFDEDNIGSNWGHAQFGGWSRVLKAWEDIGSPEVARQLIAAIIRTAQVARALCRNEEVKRRQRNEEPLKYISDMYLFLITERLWELMPKASSQNKKGKEKATATTTSAQATTSANVGGKATVANVIERDMGEAEGQSNDILNTLELVLKPLNKTDVATLIKSRQLGTYKTNATRKDLISLIHSALSEKTPADLDTFTEDLRKAVESIVNGKKERKAVNT